MAIDILESRVELRELPWLSTNTLRINGPPSLFE